MLNRRICIFGLAANPPTIGHIALVKALVRCPRFNERIVYPSGARERIDKNGLGGDMLAKRKTMCQMSFDDIPGICIVYRDLEKNIFATTYDLDRYFRDQPGVESVHHVIGSDIITGGAQKQSVIHQVWANGDEVFETLDFVVIPRTGYPLNPHDLPPKSFVLEVNIPEVSSTEVRRRCHAGESIHGLVAPEVEQCIQQNGLYR